MYYSCSSDNVLTSGGTLVQHETSDRQCSLQLFTIQSAVETLWSNKLPSALSLNSSDMMSSTDILV